MSHLVERHVELPGRGRTFVREASGPARAPVLVLLHGLAATAMLNWAPSLRSLAGGFRLLALDQRGHGRGIRSRGRFRLEDCADDAVALADALGLERIIPVGYSMGGPIAQLVWRRHPDRVAGLVLCATAARFAGRSGRQTISTLAPLLALAARAAPSRVWKQAAERMLARGVSDPSLRRWIREEVDGTDPGAVIEAGAALARFDSRFWVGKIDVPTAVVVPTEDEHVDPARQVELAEAIPEAEVYRVAGNHYVCVVRPDLFVPTLYAACRSVAERTPVRVTG